MHATLSVDLSALSANYRLLQSKTTGECGAVVKANAYGLGVEAVSKTLYEAGCKKFFVATLEEAIELRSILPDVTIAVFNGIFEKEEKEFIHHRLIPVINTLGELERVQSSGVRGQGIIIHVDTGMTRLGLNESDLKKLPRPLTPDPRSLTVMSHLACADEPAHPKNAEQLARFKVALQCFPGAMASLANSAGIFLPPEFHFDIARPGCALYGINPTEGKNPMRHVATLSAPILQIRTLERDETVGYDATHTAKNGARIAVAALGYADGYSRALSNKGLAFIAAHKVPIIGRISMDMIALDISAVPEMTLSANVHAEFINTVQTVNDVANMCDTIGYEVFTRIGQRVKRVYS